LIRTDILHDKKCIHIKLTKDVHLKLREKLFQYQLSMQSIFDEFARLVIEDEKSAIKVLEDLALKRAREQIEKPIKKSTSYNRDSINELDHNTLYNMINDD
jgi:hypothetical protein